MTTQADSAGALGTSLAWLKSWDGLMHAFTKEQATPDFAVLALCGHISRPKSVSKADGTLCMGCLMVFGEAKPDNERRWQG